MMVIDSTFGEHHSRQTIFTLTIALYFVLSFRSVAQSALLDDQHGGDR